MAILETQGLRALEEFRAPLVLEERLARKVPREPRAIKAIRAIKATPALTAWCKVPRVLKVHKAYRVQQGLTA